ncbi:MAG: phage tail protein [Magnetospirillum sp.]|nr:phage tail protein [Magnetospirillum sp.]
MSFIAGGSARRVQQPPRQPASALRIQTSLMGVPVALVGGKARIAGNLVWYGDFQAIPQSSSAAGSGGGGKGGRGSGCFAPETLISTPWGKRPLGKPAWMPWPVYWRLPRWLRRIFPRVLPIRPGDPVWCLDPETGEKISGTVQIVHIHDVANDSHDKMLRLRFLAGRSGHEIHVTENHYLWLDGKLRREAKDWRPGDRLIHEDHGRATITRIVSAPDIPFTYNLTILPHHNFFAGGILAHNGGGGGSGKSSGSYTYQAAMIFGLCEGPLTAVRYLWNSSAPTTLAADNFVALDGAQGQPPWGYLATNHPAQALGYSGLACVAAAPFDLGSNSSLPTLTWEVLGAVCNAVTESWTVQAPCTRQAQYWSLADSLTEQAMVPATAPYQVQAANPTASAALPVVTGQIDGAAIAGSASCGVKYLGGPFLIPVGADPGPGEYTVSASGLYTFSPADAGAQVVIIDLALAPGVTSADGRTFAQVLGAPGAGEFSVSASGLYTFSAADAGAALTIVDVADADPAAWVSDTLSNPRYGAGFPAANLGALAQMRAWGYANGLFISPALNTATALNTVLGDLCTGLNGEFVWSAGLLDWVPYGDQEVNGNGYVWSPPAAPVYSLGDDDFLPNTGTAASGVSTYTSSDPVVFGRTPVSQAYNDVKVEYLDRGNAYNPAVVEAADDSEIAVFGLRAKDTKQLHFFCHEQAAWVSAQLQLGREGERLTYTITVPWFYILLDPMDVIALADSALGLDGAWVRIKEISENQQDMSLTFVLEEYLPGTGAAPVFGAAPKASYAHNFNAAPGNALAPIIFEPPDALAGRLAVWIATGGGANWGGCEVWGSNDGVTYRRVGVVSNPARMGALSAALPAGTDPDTVDTAMVDLTESSGALLSGTSADADLGHTACWVANDNGNGGEIIAYETATLTAPYRYSLGTYLRRGMYGTGIGAHAAGAAFVRIDDALCKIPFTADQIGTTLHIKLLSFNLWGAAEQALEDVPSYSYTLTGSALASPLPPVTGLSTAYIAGITQLTWDPVTDFRRIDYEIREGASPQTARRIGDTPLVHAPTAGDGTYWVAAHYQVPNGPDVYSTAWASVVVAGSQLTSNVIATRDQAAEGWQGIFSGTALSGQYLTLTGAGDITQAADVTAIADVVYYGGIAASGTYQIPAADRIDVGRVATCNVLITLLGAIAYDVGAVDITQVTDITQIADVIGIDTGGRAQAVPQIRLSQDGVAWGDWQTWIPGAYTGRVFDCRILLTSADPQVSMLLTDLVFAVDVPDRVDRYVTLAVPAGGLTLQFTPDGATAPVPFNGGPGGGNLPLIQVTILGAQAGDTAVVTGESLSQATIQVVNGGAGVARSVNLTVEGY